MSGFLFDTSVLSALTPDKPPLDKKVADWIRKETDNLFVPSLALQEIRRGIAKLDRAGGSARAQGLLAWLYGIIESYGERVLPIDADTAMTAGTMEDAAIAAGPNPGLADVLIAATAKTHSLTVLTANLRHFQPLGIPCFNPFDGVP